MNKKVINELNHISIEKYLREYIGIINEDLIGLLSNLSHKEFKEVCDKFSIVNLTRVAFDDITIEEIQMGEILLVSDKSSNLAPYVNPNQFELITDNSHSILDETYDDYIDMLEQIVTDPTISDTTIKHLSYKKLINRRGDSSD